MPVGRIAITRIDIPPLNIPFNIPLAPLALRTPPVPPAPLLLLSEALAGEPIDLADEVAIEVGVGSTKFLPSETVRR